MWVAVSTTNRTVSLEPACRRITLYSSAEFVLDLTRIR